MRLGDLRVGMIIGNKNENYIVLSILEGRAIIVSTTGTAETISDELIGGTNWEVKAQDAKIFNSNIDDLLQEHIFQNYQIKSISDLDTGNIVTLRDGSLGIVFDRFIIVLNEKNSTNTLQKFMDIKYCYNEDLTNKLNEADDIISVRDKNQIIYKRQDIKVGDILEFPYGTYLVLQDNVNEDKDSLIVLSKHGYSTMEKTDVLDSNLCKIHKNELSEKTISVSFFALYNSFLADLDKNIPDGEM